MRKAHEEFEEADDSGKILLQNKSIYLFGEITPNSTGNFIAALKEIDSKPGVITVNICSAGGWVEGGMVMYDVIKSSKNKVITVGCGAVYSSAIMPFEAGDFRVMYKSSRLFFHDMSLNIGDAGFRTVRAAVNETSKLYALYCQYISERASMAPERVSELCRRESYISSEDCLTMGLVDKVIGPNDSKFEAAKSKVKSKKKGKK